MQIQFDLVFSRYHCWKPIRISQSLSPRNRRPVCYVTDFSARFLDEISTMTTVNIPIIRGLISIISSTAFAMCRRYVVLFTTSNELPKTVSNDKCQTFPHSIRSVSVPTGTLTFSRQVLNVDNCNWSASTALLTRLHISQEGTIEDFGDGMLQVRIKITGIEFYTF